MPDHFLDPLDPRAGACRRGRGHDHIADWHVVFANDYRHPALLAKEAATLDLLSDGRFEFGLGAGWFQKEYEQAGSPSIHRGSASSACRRP